MQQSRYAEAAGVFEPLAKLNPADTNVRSNYVVSLIHAGDMDGARAAAGAARQAFPQIPWFDFCLARVEARTGHMTEALDLLQTALRKDAEARDWLDKVDEFEAYRGTPAFEAILSAAKKK